MRLIKFYFVFMVTFSLNSFAAEWVDTQSKISWNHLGRVSGNTYLAQCASLGEGWRGMSEQMVGVTQVQLFASLKRLVADSPLSKSLTTLMIPSSGRRLAALWYLHEGVIHEKSESIVGSLDIMENFLKSPITSIQTKALARRFLDDFGSFRMHHQNRDVGAYLVFHQAGNGTIDYWRDEITGIRGGLCEVVNRSKHTPGCLSFWPLLPAESISSELDGLCYSAR